MHRVISKSAIACGPGLPEVWQVNTFCLYSFSFFFSFLSFLFFLFFFFVDGNHRLNLHIWLVGTRTPLLSRHSTNRSRRVMDGLSENCSSYRAQSHRPHLAEGHRGESTPRAVVCELHWLHTVVRAARTERCSRVFPPLQSSPLEPSMISDSTPSSDNVKILSSKLAVLCRPSELQFGRDRDWMASEDGKKGSSRRLIRWQ